MANLKGDSSTAATPAVSGVNTGSGGSGVYGSSDTGPGVRGESKSSRGVFGSSTTFHGVSGKSTDGIGVVGESDNGSGVTGVSKKWIGVYGESTESEGVHGVGKVGAGVSGNSEKWIGVYGESTESEGVRGVSHSTHGAVVGFNDFVPTEPPEAPGGHGGWFESLRGEGVHAETQSFVTAAMAVYQKNADSPMPALHVEHQGRRWAAHFVGNVVVTDGDITLANADCAEDFDVADEASAEPGTVMVLDDESKLRESVRPYDKRVAGVVSGAGNYKPGLVLDKQLSEGNRQPIALLGKVFCKVDAQFGSIEVGDLLTTSPTAGHAMRADDPFKAFGAVIGKALRPLPDGRGLIPILIALQ
jgi:hypothetical protein